MEEAFKMRNLLQEFLKCQGRRPPTILGLREHIFTERSDLLKQLKVSKAIGSELFKECQFGP